MSKADGCWLWTGSVNALGYGQFRLAGRSQLAHRVAWILTNGAIPDGLDICHHCDNPPCVNPAHLFAGTAADNLRDMRLKGRASGPRKPVRGTEHRMAKLTEADIPIIRQRVSDGETLAAIGKDYGVSLSTIWLIGKRRLWRHVL